MSFWGDQNSALEHLCHAPGLVKVNQQAIFGLSNVRDLGSRYPRLRLLSSSIDALCLCVLLIISNGQHNKHGKGAFELNAIGR